jgi:hypothetical protein
MELATIATLKMREERGISRDSLACPTYRSAGNAQG